MYIYHKQCKIIQKDQWKGSNSQLQSFYKGTSMMSWNSLLKTRKTRKTKTYVTQNFGLLKLSLFGTVFLENTDWLRPNEDPPLIYIASGILWSRYLTVCRSDQCEVKHRHARHCPGNTLKPEEEQESLRFGVLNELYNYFAKQYIALFDLSISNIDCRYIDTFEIYRYPYPYPYRYR